MYTIQVIKVSLLLLNSRQRIQMILLLGFYLFSALIQIAGVASIGPFIAILSSPEIIHKNALLSYCFAFFKFTEDTKFIMAFATVSLIMIILSNALSILTLWLSIKFSITFGGELQSRLFRNFIGRPYIYHKIVNHSKPITTILHESPRFVYMVIQPLLLLFSNLFVALIILLGLVLLNPIIAVSTALIIGGAYLGTYLILKKSLARHGALISEKNNTSQMILSEVFVGIKDIILSSLGNNYARKFEKNAMQGLNSTAYITLSGDTPKFVIETISFGAILSLAIVFLLKSESAATIISMLSIYALAGYKLLPTMQQIYKSISSLSAHGSVPFGLHEELKANSLIKQNNAFPLEAINDIELKSIEYIYPNTPNKVLKNVNLKFSKGKINTIAGHSGSGKSTLIDIILGLLVPSNGHILVDGKRLEETLAERYQKSIGYVPQDIFLLDDSIAANIAFGIPKDEIDFSKVIKALTIANAIDFVNLLPNGIHSNLGQDGKLLSGGQRQRIGIARSLYRENKILILDEPTSALDIESEFEFIQSLLQLRTEVLIIVISHRPAAIKCSDSITLIDHGIVVAHGTFEQLLATNSDFKEMIEKSKI